MQPAWCESFRDTGEHPDIRTPEEKQRDHEMALRLMDELFRRAQR